MLDTILSSEDEIKSKSEGGRGMKEEGEKKRERGKDEGRGIEGERRGRNEGR